MLAGLGRHQSRERALVVGCVVATISFLVAGLFEYNVGDSEVVMVEYFVMALAYAATRPLRAPARWISP